MDSAHLGLRVESPEVIVGLKWETCEDFKVSQVGVAIKAAGRKIRIVGRLWVVCSKLAALLREDNAVRSGSLIHWFIFEVRGFSGVIQVMVHDGNIFVIISFTYRDGGNLWRH